MVNVAAQILDEEIRKLQELKQMAGNPRILDLIRRIVQATDTNSTQPINQASEHKAPPAKPSLAKKNNKSPNGLTPAVQVAAASLGKAFTVPQMVQMLDASGFEFVGQDHQAATSSAVKALVKRKLIRLARKGSGPNPHWYEYAGENSDSRGVI